MKYLLDTCVLSELIKSEPNPAVLAWVNERADPELFTAAMVMAELHRGVAKLPVSRRKQDLSAWLIKLQRSLDTRVLPFTVQTAEHWAAMCARAEGMGKTIAAFDSMIAACALENGLTLVTRNVQDFAFTSVLIVNPWESQDPCCQSFPYEHPLQQTLHDWQRDVVHLAGARQRPSGG